MTGDETVRRLLDLEEIKQLKARYFQYMDTKDWEAWRELFTTDLRVDGTKQAPDLDRDQFVDGVAASLAEVRTCHHGHMPIIEITGPNTARGVWAMWDELRFEPGHPWSEGYSRRLGYGHYEEEYRRDDDGWRISFLRLTRLWVWRERESGPLVDGGVASSTQRWRLGRQSAEG